MQLLFTRISKQELAADAWITKNLYFNVSKPESADSFESAEGSERVRKHQGQTSLL